MMETGLGEKQQAQRGSDSVATFDATSIPTDSDVPGSKRRKLRSSTNEYMEDEPGENASEIVSRYIQLEPLPLRASRLPGLSQSEVQELERVLEFRDSGDEWREDWAGNLAFVDKEVSNPMERGREKQKYRQPLIDWARRSPENTRFIANLIRYVSNQKDVPDGAKKVLASVDLKSVESMDRAIRRTSYDPTILQQDGWTTEKAKQPEGATGGAYLIGDQIRWEHSDAIVIAYVHDADIGDLWKAIWTDHTDVVAFDLEAEELLEARRKWERRQAKQSLQPDPSTRKSTRVAVSSDFRVKGIENGIVLAGSYSKGARPGVFWPARVMHASETFGSVGKRNSSKQKLDLVFLAPYWSSDDSVYRGSRRVESLSESGSSVFSSGPLLLYETIDAAEDMIIEYPYDAENGIDMDQLRTAFRFTGLPRAAFPRFLDSHRLALSLQQYASAHLQRQITESEMATAGLFETHPMAVLAPTYPSVVLELPFGFILSQLPHPAGEFNGSVSSDNGGRDFEPVLNLARIVEAMKPPFSWGSSQESPATPMKAQGPTSLSRASTPGAWLGSLDKVENGGKDSMEFDQMFDDLSNLQNFFSQYNTVGAVGDLIRTAHRFFSSFPKSQATESFELTDKERRIIVNEWAIFKKFGEEVISSFSDDKGVLGEWRRLAERLYKLMVSPSANRGFKNGVTTVLTDSRCNLHKTSTTCFERSVRLPAALKAAKLAGVSIDGAKRLVSTVPQKYVDLVESTILKRAHSAAYLKRMKGRCKALKTDDEIIKLTDESDGKGGEDTMGSRGTWMAAVCGVAGAIAGVDMIVGGETVNAFCVTRPPGHHAGRSIHPMKAVSNGFCVLNPVACAAIYATTPALEGGLGLSRVCVIDFDVHHGNGTQDILCSTYDPRFLYVSIHAGGPEVNGISHEDDPNHELHDLQSKSGGIFPGRCGDTSPHPGVLNIPLGPVVTSHAVGTAFIRHVSPTVESFAPDLIILSAGFDAHKNDPMQLGSLSAEDFGHITEVACQLAFRTCSGRVLSVLEGGYGVPCCRPQRDLICEEVKPSPQPVAGGSVPDVSESKQPDAPREIPRAVQPTKLLDLDGELPDEMDDQVPYALQRRLEKCHAEGFIECVKEHIESLARCNTRK